MSIKQQISTKTVGLIMDCLHRNPPKSGDYRTSIIVKIGRQTREQCLSCLTLVYTAKKGQYHCKCNELGINYK